MDTSFLVVVAFSLLVLTGMIVVRMGASGVSASRIVVAAAELWAAVGIWTLTSSSVAARGVPPWELFRAASPWEKVGLVVALLLAAHLMWSLRSPTPRGRRG